MIWQKSSDTVLVSGDRLWVRLALGAWHRAPAIGVGGVIGGLADVDDAPRGFLVEATAAALACLI